MKKAISPLRLRQLHKTMVPIMLVPLLVTLTSGIGFQAAMVSGNGYCSKTGACHSIGSKMQGRGQSGKMPFMLQLKQLQYANLASVLKK